MNPQNVCNKSLCFGSGGPERSSQIRWNQIPSCALIWKTWSLCFARLVLQIATQHRPHTHTHPNTASTHWLPTLRRQCSKNGWRWSVCVCVCACGCRVCTLRHVFTLPLSPPCPNYLCFRMPRPNIERLLMDQACIHKDEAGGSMSGAGGQIGCTD